MCNRIHDVEWSGTLFYTAEGSMEDGTFKVTCVDFLPMDIGTACFTQYDESVDVVDYMVQHPELLENGIYQGLIHSHNNMATFFSGTDTDTLLSEGSDTVHFVSLIVNNAGKYTAGVTRKVVREIKANAHVVLNETSYYNSYQDNRVQLTDNKITEKDQEQVKKEEFIEWFGLTIEKEEVDNSFEEVDERIKEIRKNKAAKVSTTSSRGNYSYGYGYNYGGYKPSTPLFSSPVNNTRPTSVPSNPVKPITTINDRVSSSVIVSTPEKNLIKEDTTQLGLFDDINNTEEPIPLCLLEEADKGLIGRLAGQLLTGDILYDGTSDLSNWVTLMDRQFEKRFGSFNDKDNEERYYEWLEKLVETIVYEPDEALLDRLSVTYSSDFDTADTAEIIAYDLIKYLEDLPDSYCKECIISELRTYLPDAVDESLDAPSARS